MRILLVEDDVLLADYTHKRLKQRGFEVQVCHDGPAGLNAAETKVFDLILLDVMLPHLSGIEVVKRLRLLSNWTPIIILTALDSPEDVVAGLEAGADDYVAKPFTFEVLLARVRARLRAVETLRSGKLRFGDILLDTETHEAFRDSQLLSLTRTEFAILECLMRSSGRVVTRSKLIETVWQNREISDKTVDTFMRFLREKVEVPGTKKLIRTERGIGYRLYDSQ